MSLRSWLRKKARGILYDTPPYAPGHSGGLISLGLVPRTKINYAAEVGEGLTSSVFMSPVKWLQRTFPEAPFEVLRVGTEEDEEVFGHPLTQLLRRPNAYYTGNALWSATIFSWIHGNGYWVKLRTPRTNTPWYSNTTGEVLELWYVPHWLIEPKFPRDNSVFISHYLYSAGGGTKPVEVAPENVVHFRNGIDPRNPRKGLSLIESEVREMFTDAEAANYAASILKNMGVPGLVISPKHIPGVDIEVSPEARDALKAEVKETLTGDKRGDPLVTSGPTEVVPFGFDPKSMDVQAIRSGNESRLCAALGIPAAVVGFVSGMEQTKVGATMLSLKRLAWEGCIIPMQNSFSEAVEMGLLPEFEAKPENFRCWFNYSDVPAMQENMLETARAIDLAVRGGWVMVSTGQKKLGVDVDPAQNVYLRRVDTVEVPEGTIRENEPEEPGPDEEGIPPAKSRIKSASDRRFLRVQGRLEREAKADIADLFASESRAMQKAHRQSVKSETKDWLENVAAELRARWEALLAEIIGKSIAEGWELAEDEISELIDFDVYEPRAATFARTQAAAKVQEITETTAGQIREVIADAIEQGWSTDKTTKAIKETYEDFGRVRAETIARTETSNAVNHGKHKAAEETAAETGLELERVWSAVNDGRTREAHSNANGQVRKMGAAFLVGGESLMYPGDPAGSAANVIRCRCTQIFREIQS